MKELEKIYDPSKVEDRLYSHWEKKGYFNAEVDQDKNPFTIVMPPPNVTGQLHMGHALDQTLQDILIRFKRMQGYSALWLPGTDHAGIATQVKVEEQLVKEEGINRHDLGREKFLEKVWIWKEKYGNHITNQVRKIGASCDWSRERFTLDEGCSKAVREVFVNLYNKNLIYRDEKIINWCPECETALSNAEVEYDERQGHFWHIKYPVKDAEEFLEIATTRPETMLGDEAVAVNPNDERYKHLIGKKLVLPVVGKEIPIIADEYVDMEFGTGAVKITPAHDPNDFEVGRRHNLPITKIMNDKGEIANSGTKYDGMPRYEARKALVRDLEEQGVLVNTRQHQHNVGTHDRCGTVVEPITSTQWFVKMQPLAEPAIDTVKTEKTQFIPERFEKIYFNWMENIHDWCISRQLWWGHQIPAFYCQECGETMVTKEDPAACTKCGSHSIKQDPDVLDTWFSSALWPFSTLGWPDETPDFKYFYPNDVLVTGFDIIFFWVARMIFSGIEHTGSTPFEHVLIHGLVRDSEGRKMSKSLGNGVDPLEVIEKYGADALRFSLATGNAPGNDMRFYYERVESSRNFANKIWNATRFVMMNLEDYKEDPDRILSLDIADQWILSRINTVIAEVTENLEKYELGVALSKIYDFIWDEYCDWYIEMVKPRLYDKNASDRYEAQYTLKTVLLDMMKLLHPFMPFITEEIFTNMQEEEETIMKSKWPTFRVDRNFKDAEENVNFVKEAIKNIRNVRAEMNVVPSRKAKLIFVTTDTSLKRIIESSSAYFEKLASASEVLVQGDKTGIEEDAVSIVVAGATIFIPFAELVDIEKEVERLMNERKKLEAELKRVEGKLNNQSFISKAPAAVIEEEKQKKEKYKSMMEQVLSRLSALGK